MEYYIKAILIVTVVIFAFIILFSLIYFFIKKADDNIPDKSYIEALYTAVTIQTTIGMDSEPTNQGLKIAYMIQSLLAYFITLGFIYIILKNVYKSHSQIPIKKE